MIREITILIAYLFTEFAIYILAYKVIFQKRINRNIYNWMAVIIIIGMVHGITYVYSDLCNAMSISMFSMIVIPSFLLEKREKEGFLLYPIVLMGTSVFAVSGTYVMALLFSIPEDMLMEGSLLTILCQMVPIFILIALQLYRHCKKKTTLRLEMDRQQYVLFYIVIICSYLMLSCMQVLSSEKLKLTLWERNMCGLAISVACMAMIWFSCKNAMVVYNERIFREKNEAYENYIKLQEEHFKEILHQDESMRRFRHDMNSHIIALRELCASGDNAALKEYIDNIVEYSEIYKVEEYTANKTIDAVIRQLVSEAENKSINIKIQGCYLQLARVSIYDFCSIIYNLMKNAIEACEKIEDVNDRMIEMKLAEYNNKILLMIRNRVYENVSIEKNSLKTTKRDKKNHGLGSGNVEQAVKKYNGSIEYHFEKGYFTVEMYI